MSTVLDFEGIEDAILAKLKADLGAYVPSIETYAGQIDDILEGRAVKFPLVAVMFQGERFEEVDGPQHYSTAEFIVGVFAHSLRGQEETRRGAATGAYRLIRDVKGSLINARLADNVQTLKPTEVRNIMSTPTVMAYALNFTVSMDQTYDWPT
jgi:phage gp37-like protein